MKISIAGAGAGKTTKIAHSIIECYDICDVNKVIFCITYTNNATQCIKCKIIQHYGYLPKRIHISTIHSFLYNEIIKPYYHLLFGIHHYNGISTIDLSHFGNLKQKKFNDLENEGYLHLEAIPKRAKWVLVNKDRDKKDIKTKKKLIQKVFKSYCGGIFLDEAQDIDDDTYEILLTFQSLELNIHIMGDPKQDLKGFKNLHKLIKDYPSSVRYIKNCYRCPVCHLKLSNSLITKEEQQISLTAIKGSLSYVYENNVSLQDYLNDNNFGLVYISEKNERFETKKVGKRLVYDSLYRELECTLSKEYPNKDKRILSRNAYNYAYKMYTDLQQGKSIQDILNRFGRTFSPNKDKFQLTRLEEILEELNPKTKSKVFVVHSIDAVKGMEDENCLFILTPDLVPYLIGNRKEDNRTKHKLYVALTRSTKQLCILITKEVEEKFGSSAIDKFMSTFVTTQKV